jgi:hypothetical protein
MCQLNAFIINTNTSFPQHLDHPCLLASFLVIDDYWLADLSNQLALLQPRVASGINNIETFLN